MNSISILNNNSNNLTMSSRDLLDLINKVRGECGEKSVRVNQFHERVKDELSDFNYKTFVVQNSNKTTSTYFHLDHEMCLLVGMRESKQVRRKVLEALKNKFEKQQIPTTLPEALRLAADMAEQIEANKPKVLFYDKFVDTAHTKSLRLAANVIGIAPYTFIDMLLKDKILYRLGCNLYPYAKYVAKGWFEIKEGQKNWHNYTQTRVTAKGEFELSKRYKMEIAG